MITTDRTDLDDARCYIRDLEREREELQARIDRALEIFDESSVFMTKLKEALNGDGSKVEVVG